jgi:hypothetical protein
LTYIGVLCGVVEPKLFVLAPAPTPALTFKKSWLRSRLRLNYSLVPVPPTCCHILYIEKWICHVFIEENGLISLARTYLYKFRFLFTTGSLANSEPEQEPKLRYNGSGSTTLVLCTVV